MQLAVAVAINQPEISTQRLRALVAGKARRMEPVYQNMYNQQSMREPALVSLESRLQEPLVAACAKHCLLFLRKFCSLVWQTEILKHGNWSESRLDKMKYITLTSTSSRLFLFAMALTRREVSRSSSVSSPFTVHCNVYDQLNGLNGCRQLILWCYPFTSSLTSCPEWLDPPV